MSALPEVRLPAQSDELGELELTYKGRKNLTIQTPQGYVAISDELKQVKAKINELEERRDRQLKPLNAALREIREHWKQPIEYLVSVEKAMKLALSVFKDAQDKRQREEQAKAQAEADRARVRLVQRAERAAEKGKMDKAVSLELQASMVTAPIVPSELPEVDGLSYREIWKFRIVDASAVPREYTSPDEVLIGKVVRAMKGKTNIAGIEVYSELSTASKSE